MVLMRSMWRRIGLVGSSHAFVIFFYSLFFFVLYSAHEPRQTAVVLVSLFLPIPSPPRS